MIDEFKAYRTSDGRIFDNKELALQHETSLVKNSYEVELHYHASYYTVVEAISKEDAIRIAEEEMELEYLCLEEGSSYARIVEEED